MRPRRLYPPFWLLVSGAAMVGLRLLLPRPTLVPAPCRYWIGGAMILAGAILALRARRLFRKARTTLKPFEKSQRLVVRGPFRVSRNPIYLGMAVVLAGLATLLGAAAPWAALPLFVIVITVRFIRAEEQILEETFGEEYRQYQRQVRRWL